MSLKKALSPLRHVASPRRHASAQSPLISYRREASSYDEPQINSLTRKFGNLLTADCQSINKQIGEHRRLFGGWYEVKLLRSVEEQHEKKFAIPCLDTDTINTFIQSDLDKGFSFNILGRGSFGTVLEAIYKGNYIAAKLVDKQRHPDAIFTLENESNGMGLCHPNIIHIIKVINPNKQFGIVLMEKCCGTELQKILDDPQYPITEARKLRYTLDIAEALLYCHRRNILHLDVKPRNVIVCENTDRCKLFDFGSSLNLKKQSNKQRNLMSTVIYTAPEMFKGEEETPAVDVYALGITMWQIEQREIPYSMYHTAEELILQVSAGLRPKLSTSNDAYTDLYRECWKDDPLCRPNMLLITHKLSEMADEHVKSQRKYYDQKCLGEICFYSSLQ
ncbi:serine/threonine-protein kinase mos-like [Schistocerca gregaria]|uniref:serine/threonine-protein kinase mos-like n=1 Tax=Schistocerca gregaria TaxID=7010 RepID=UPI00211E9433|nr:serine/threonine-protein kinase mos-like [Schistocerca gregaria]